MVIGWRRWSEEGVSGWLEERGSWCHRREWVSRKKGAENREGWAEGRREGVVRGEKVGQSIVMCLTFVCSDIGLSSNMS